MAKTTASPCLYSIRNRPCGNKTTSPTGLCPKHVGRMLDSDVDKARAAIPRVGAPPVRKRDTEMDSIDKQFAAEGGVFADDPLSMRVGKDVRWFIHRATGLFGKEFRRNS